MHVIICGSLQDGDCALIRGKDSKDALSFDIAEEVFHSWKISSHLICSRSLRLTYHRKGRIIDELRNRFPDSQMAYHSLTLHDTASSEGGCRDFIASIAIAVAAVVPDQLLPLHNSSATARGHSEDKSRIRIDFMSLFWSRSSCGPTTMSLNCSRI
jgi:hypothetical protein